MHSLFVSRGIRWYVAMLAVLFLTLSIPNTGLAQTRDIDPAKAAQIMTDLAKAGGSSDLLSTVQQLLGMAQALQSLFGTISNQGANEPCEGVVIYPTDTPNCKRIKSGMGAGGGGGAPDLQSVLGTINGVKDLISQFQQMTGGGGGGSSSSSGGSSSGSGQFGGNAGTSAFGSPSGYDSRFGNSLDDLRAKLENSVNGLSDVKSAIETGQFGDSSVTSQQQNELQLLRDTLQPAIGGLVNNQYQSDRSLLAGSPNNESKVAIGGGLQQQIVNLLDRLNPVNVFKDSVSKESKEDEQDSDTAESEYTISDINSISARYVDPDSRMADEEYYVYKVNLNNGETRTVTLPAFAPIGSNMERLAKSGYRGSALAFMALAEQQDTSYTINEVTEVTVAKLNPLADTEVDNYMEYTITLGSGIQFTVHTHSDMTSAEIENNFRNTGYEGNIDQLISEAIETDEIGDISFFSYVKKLVFNGISNILALFTGDDEDNYTEFPDSQVVAERYTGTNTFKASPTSGDAPLDVTFTINHPNTTLVFGDGTMSTVSCDLDEPEDTDSYDLDDVKEIVYAEIPLPEDDSEWHRVYKIKLDDGSVRTAHHFSKLHLRNMWDSFRATGYTGDIQDLRDRARETRGEDFGYKTSDNNPNGTCNEPTVIEHTYSNNATYTAKLFEGSVSGCENGCNEEASFSDSAELGRISIVMGDDETNKKEFSASPAFGDSPLTVTFYTTFGDLTSSTPGPTDQQETMIDFGDGSDMARVLCNNSKCQFEADGGSLTDKHTYQTNGVYRARIVRTGGMCAGECPITELANLNVVVGGDATSDPNFTASPTQGSTPLTVSFTSYYGIKNGSGIQNDDVLLLEYGDGSDPKELVCQNSTSNNGFGSNVACTMDAKICPDGSAVGRVGPNCEFAACPGSGQGSNQGSGTCTSDGKDYPAGSTLSEIVNDNGISQNIADGIFICSNGSWVVKSNSQDSNACISNGKHYPAGSTLSEIVNSDGTSQSIADGIYICDGGKWIVKDSRMSIPSDGLVCALPIKDSHTYNQSGNYYATVTKWNTCPNSRDDDALCESTIIASVPIVVGDNQKKIMTVSPATGLAPLNVTFSGNYCDTAQLKFGDKSESIGFDVQGTNCSNFSYTHTYKNAGNYVAVLRNSNNEVIDTATISVTQKVVPNNTNVIDFEVRSLGTGSIDAVGGSVSPGSWTPGNLLIKAGEQLAFRWNASQYESCIPFLADNGTYALSRRGDSKMLTGNTETEGFNINERNGEYRIECAGQSNGEEGVDTKIINITIKDNSPDDSAGGSIFDWFNRPSAIGGGTN